MRERAKLAPKSGVQLGKSALQSQHIGKVLKDLIEPGHITLEYYIVRRDKHFNFVIENDVWTQTGF